MDLTEEQWKVVKEFIPQDAVREDRRGRPWSDRRRAFNGILWILRTGAPWQDLPERYGAYQTVQRRFQHWRKQGVIDAVLRGLARDLHERGGLDLSECFLDGSFAAARPGGAKIGKTKRGKGCKIIALGDAHDGLPIAIYTDAAAPAEVKLVEATLQRRLVKEKPLRIIADKAYDSDPLRERLLEEEMLLLAPHRRGRTKPSFNDGRWLRRYAKRWKIERLFAWLHNFRRLVVRWEYHAENYLAFLQLGCAIILLRHL
jgi:transposase